VTEQASPPAEGTTGEEVIVVTGTRSETPRAASPVTIEVISRQRLVESGVQTVSEALALRPGLWIERGIAGTMGISMQGLGAKYSLVLVDGARQIGRTEGSLDLDRFGVEDIEQIEIMRGPSSALYGSDAIGGVVNIITRQAREGVAFDGLARVDGRLGYELRGRLAGGARGYAGALSASYRDGAAIRLADEDNEIETTFDAYTDAHVTGRGTHRRGEAWRFDASADYLRRDLRGVDLSGVAVFDRRNLVETATVQTIATWTGERTAVRVEADGSIYRDQFLSDQRMAGDLDHYELTEEDLVEGRAQVAHQVGRHRVLVGAELLHETLASPRLAMPGDRYRAAIYAQDEWRLGAEDQAVVVPSARLDVDSQFGTHGTPRLAARWQLPRRVVARGSVGLGYRAPSFKELLLRFSNEGVGYAVVGNPDLEPETSSGAQAGGEWQATSWLWLSADAHATWLRQMITFTPLPDDGSGVLRFGYVNIERARTIGLETNAVAVHGRAALELGWAMTRSRDLDAGRALEGQPTHRVTVTARWRDPRERLDAFVAAVVTGRRPYYLSIGDTETERRIELRARIGKRFRSGFGGFLGIDNALDAGDANLDPVLPRTLYAGVEVHL
jgi:outer membrane receptor for ferrienterochelin and colicins